MLTPFDDAGRIDWDDMESLIEWCISNGSNALFAVCQSSEMQFLSFEERVELACFTAKITNGRIPVVASGHVADSRDDQIAELNAIANTGIDGLVLLTNRLDTKNTGKEAFRENFNALLRALPSEIPLGFYECPTPFRRLLSDDEFKATCNSGRFSILKDTLANEMISNIYRVNSIKVRMAAHKSLLVTPYNAERVFDEHLLILSALKEQRTEDEISAMQYHLNNSTQLALGVAWNDVWRLFDWNCINCRGFNEDRARPA